MWYKWKKTFTKFNFAKIYIPINPHFLLQTYPLYNIYTLIFFRDTRDDEATSSTFTLKWFTPICEVNLCGHATLATAAVLYDIIHNPNTVLSFSTLSGILKATHNKDDHTISLDFPLSPCEVQDMTEHHDLIKNTITSPHLNVVDCQYSAVTKKLLVRLADDITRSQLETLIPNTQSLVTVEQSKVKGIIVTVKAEEEKYDFYSRYFAPWVGIPEDPVTGITCLVVLSSCIYI